MCGICGIAYRDEHRPLDTERLLHMRDAMPHRGPDGAGHHVAGGVGLGHRRLSIIDLSGGAQPLANEDGSVHVTFNGEIYNYRDLTSGLLAHGHRFRTHSDTEVLVHGYEEYGLDLLPRLDGMFAFAIHDTHRKRLVLARDQLGIKPLFYAVTAEGLFFASEPKALFAAAALTPVLDPDALQEYLIFRYNAWSRTFFQGVRRLPPGHVAVWENGQLSIRPFWTAAPSAPASHEDFDAATDALEQRLDHAVNAQLMSDVPLGTFCSGGVDSGLVTALAARHATGRLHTFSVGFEDPAWDETPLASDTARRLGTEHHVLRTRAEDVGDLVQDLIRFHDEPLSHPNSVPLFLLSRFARQHVTVVLTGEGADELFCGYPRYHLARAAGVMRGWPGGLVRGLTSAIGALPGHRAALARRVLPRPYPDTIVYNSAYVDPETVASLTGRPVEGAVAERRNLAAAAAAGDDPVASLSRYELQTYLVCALDRMDRMSMASSLEGRVPFLSVPLVEWGMGLPTAARLRGRDTKRIVKAVAARFLSERIVRGPKSGFGLPLGAWFRGPQLRGILDRLLDRNHAAAGHVDHNRVRTLVAEHRSGQADHGELLWLLTNVYLWHEVHAGNTAGPVSAPSALTSPAAR